MQRKYTFKNRSAHNFAPIHIVHETLSKTGVPDKIRELLPCEGKGKYLKYSNYDALAGLFTSILFGNKRMAQMAAMTKAQFYCPSYQSRITYYTIKEKMQGLIDNPDLEKRMINGKSKYYSIYRCPRLNTAILHLADYLKLIPKDVPLIIDIDTTLLNTKGKHSSVHYMKKSGYNPLLICINRIPIYYETRTGAINPKNMLWQAVDRVVTDLRNLGYTVEYVRIDAAGYSVKNVAVFDRLKLKYIIRAMVEHTLQKKHGSIQERHRMFGTVYSRYIYNRDNPSNKLFALITNDFKTPAEEINKMYQDRGCSEQMIRDLKDFGWKTMIFHSIRPNSSYMGFCVLAFLLYKFTCAEYSQRLDKSNPDFITPHMTLNVFRRKFLDCVGHWQDDTLVLYETKNQLIYEALIQA
jgi:hypothetical protein